MPTTEKPKVKKKPSRKDKVLSKLKLLFLDYYRELPIQKLAAESIGKAEQTIIRWKAKDAHFENQVLIAGAEWARKNSKEVKSREWLLERVMKDHFAERKEIEIGAEAKLEEALDRIAKILPASK